MFLKKAGGGPGTGGEPSGLFFTTIILQQFFTDVILLPFFTGVILLAFFMSGNEFPWVATEIFHVLYQVFTKGKPEIFTGRHIIFKEKKH